MTPSKPPDPGKWKEFVDTSWTAFLVIWDNFLYIVAATAIAYTVFVWLRNRPAVQERILPLLDDVRYAIVQALKHHRFSKDAGPDVRVVAAAIIGASLLCSITLYAFVTLLANFGTPAG